MRSWNHFTDTPHCHIRGLREKPSCRVNQYPFEHLITIKDLLGVVCRRAVRLGGCAKEEDAGTPTWLPLTYCLKRELVKFASLFQRREKRHVSHIEFILITYSHSQCYFISPWAKGKNFHSLPFPVCMPLKLKKILPLLLRGEDNHWIIKPWNLARGLDHTITNNLNHIMRLPSTGPKVRPLPFIGLHLAISVGEPSDKSTYICIGIKIVLELRVRWIG